MNGKVLGTEKERKGLRDFPSPSLPILLILGGGVRRRPLLKVQDLRPRNANIWKEEGGEGLKFLRETPFRACSELWRGQL